MMMSPYENLPAELRNLHQWVCYRLEKRKQSDGTWKDTKVPCQPNGKAASSTDPATCNSYASCVSAVGRLRIAGIGFRFSKAAGFTGIDLDKCRDDESGATEHWALAIINELGSYTELSQSGAGWHIIVRAGLAAGRDRAGRVEMYDSGRFFVMTGNTDPSVGGKEICARDLADLQNRLPALDPTHQSAGKQGNPRKRKAPAGSDKTESERDYADIALIHLITDSKDPARLEAEFQRRFPTKFETRNRVKGMRGEKNYIRYSIEHFLEAKSAQTH
jgi:putative DNA primase/helicase